MPSLYELHKAKWTNCQQCDLCNNRRNVVLYRGQIPCHVLFIGEAPGVSEDTLGQPFIGPAGKLLDQILAQILPPEIRKGFTNVVACVPDLTNGFKPPEKLQMDACAPRLVEVVDLAAPKLIVQVGRTAAHAKKVIKREVFWAEIIHPAAILRMDASQKPLSIQKTLIDLTDALTEAFSL